MRQFLRKRWHGIPVALVSALLLVCLLAGSAFAAYTFLTVAATVEVQEAIVPSFGARDDLAPYMIPESDVLPLITVGGSGSSVTLAITAGTKDASEFLPGEELILPLNLRNRSNADMPIRITVSGTPGLDLSWDFETNTVGAGFRPSLPWSGFPAGFSITTRGNFGSALVNATVFFVRIKVPLDATPGTYNLTFTFSRG